MPKITFYMLRQAIIYLTIVHKGGKYIRKSEKMGWYHFKSMLLLENG